MITMIRKLTHGICSLACTIVAGMGSLSAARVSAFTCGETVNRGR